jgi:mono/diheme cytochrome c family protein
MNGLRLSGLAVMALLLAGCPDPNLREQRGYTRAPLDRPGLLPHAEEPGEIARYGAPRRIVAARIQLPEQPAEPPAPAPRPVVELPPGVTQEMVAQGEMLYGSTGNCFACHAPDASGTPLAPALNDPTWIHIDGSFESIVAITVAGVLQPVQYPAAMPPRGGAPLSDEQIRQISAYIYTLTRP